MTLVIGITGSAGVGKSTVAEMAQSAFGIVHWDADKVSHVLMRTHQGLIKVIQQNFPDVMSTHGVDRLRLRSIVFQDVQALAQLERLIHPYIHKECQDFLKEAQSLPACILEVPLLFEVEWEKFCEITILVTAAPLIQQERLKKRGLSIAEIKGMLARQWPEEKKQAQVDYVIDAGLSKQQTWQQLEKIIKELKLA